MINLKVLKNRINLKYRLLEWDDEKLEDYLKDETSYNEFMQTLSNILITEPNYDFFIYEKADFIKKQIKQHNQNTIYEKFINKRFKTLDNFGRSDLADFKTQYAYFYTVNIKMPYPLRDEKNYDNLIRKNYENLQKIEKAIIDKDRDLIDKGDISLLITINSILYENKFIEDDLFALFEKISSPVIKKEQFEDKLDYVCYKIYQKKTLKLLKQYKIQNEKAKKLIK